MSKLHNVHTASEESSMNQDVDMFLVFANMIMQKKSGHCPTRRNTKHLNGLARVEYIRMAASQKLPHQITLG